MFRLFAQKLTEDSNYKIDWSRASELIASGTHTYSSQEIMTRASICTFSLACGLIATSLNNQSNTGYSSIVIGIVGILMGGIMGHVPIVYPLYKKRTDMEKACKQYIAEIKLHPLYINNDTALDKVLSAIMTLSLSNEGHAKASETWGRRLALLKAMKTHLDNATPQEYFPFYLSRDASAVLAELDRFLLIKLQENPQGMAYKNI